jgi:hypothetical protein
MLFTKEQILGCIPVLQGLTEIQGKPLWVSYAKYLHFNTELAGESTRSEIFQQICDASNGRNGMSDISRELVQSLKSMSTQDLREIKDKFQPLASKEGNSKYSPIFQVNRVKMWTLSLLDAIASEERDRQEKRLAFAMGGHPRLGGNSSMKDLTDDLLEKIAQSPPSAHVTCARCSKYILD